MIRMEISAVYTSSPEASYPQVVLKQVDGDNYLPIIIGRFEAAAISMAQNEDVPARPISYDLVRQILLGMECHVSKVEITELHESTYFADVHVISSDGTVRIFDARPSDAIAIALRFNAPIFASPDVLDEVGIPSAPDPHSSLEEQEEIVQISVAIEEMEQITSDLQPAETELETLKRRLAQAVAEDMYEEAARLRDEIKLLKSR
ncbi:MAG: bifunctional nuclease family protein [Candidatus Latescibacterota bacterium]|nr:bifunctional nuclease family protein [Candidatus Latescibacterota bacterium]